MDPIPYQNEKDREEDLQDEQKGLLIVLGSLFVISIVVVIGVFIFFPSSTRGGPSIFFEKNSPVQMENPSSKLEENVYLPELSQNDKSTQREKKEKEELFLEIFPNSNGTSTSHTATITKPIISLSIPENSDNNSSASLDTPSLEKKIPAESSLSESKPVSSSPPPTSDIPVSKTPSYSKAKPVTMSAKIKSPSFWVQIGSYSDEKRANNVIEKLKQEGFKAQKVKFDDGNRTLNRVRMGPYKSKSEANKFLNWVKEIPEFKESYVLQTNNSR